jgi:hypothetical protein
MGQRVAEGGSGLRAKEGAKTGTLKKPKGAALRLPLRHPPGKWSERSFRFAGCPRGFRDGRGAIPFNEMSGSGKSGSGSFMKVAYFGYAKAPTRPQPIGKVDGRYRNGAN